MEHLKQVCIANFRVKVTKVSLVGVLVHGSILMRNSCGKKDELARYRIVLLAVYFKITRAALNEIESVIVRIFIGHSPVSGAFPELCGNDRNLKVREVLAYLTDRTVLIHVCGSPRCDIFSTLVSYHYFYISRRGGLEWI
jgi:hypothetical protein